MNFSVILLSSLVLASTAFGQLKVDFNSTTQDGGPNNEPGFEAFSAPHEGATPPATETYNAFGTSISVTPSWPNTSNANVRQFIDRGSANDSNWGTTNINLLTDWLGVDTRTGNGGNGVFDGNSGTPTDFILTLGNLPAANYSWTSYHHDTENMVGDFTVELSTNNGTTYSQIGGTRTITDSTSGGNPAGSQLYDDSSWTIATLPSTVTFDFDALAGQDVKLRFRSLATANVHAAFFLINGFELAVNTPADSPTNLALSGTSASAAANIGDIVGSLSSSDPTPGDTFTYTLVSGAGSDDNGEFDIVGNNLVVDGDLSIYPGGTQLAVRIRTTDAASNFFEKSFTIEIINDSDSDGLDDSWELTYFPDLTTSSGSGNNDTDALDNAAEQAAGTNPTLADTDSDGLNDDLENNSGTYLSPTNTGSNPLNPDTDGDGINDGDEVSNANGFITNPNLADTDGDGFNDRIEIDGGHDPTNAADFPSGLQPLLINEILVSNETGFRDGNDRKNDWIELFNPNPQPVNLDGFFLTDDAANLTKWNFPDVVIGANSYLVVFASGDDMTDPSGNPHTNFRLNNSGEYLALVGPNGTAIEDLLSPTYPEQFTDISYGRAISGGGFLYFASPTPGTANGSGSPGVVKDTNFTIDRGFYDTPFNLEILSDTPNAEIRYTLDGSIPTETTGTLYTGPIAIATTANVRAMAHLPGSGFLPTNVDTHSYIFVDDVTQQPTDPAGWAENWSNDSTVGLVPSDYEMDPRVVNDVAGLRDADHTMRAALLDIPSVSVTMEQLDFVASEAQKQAGASLSLYGTPRSRFEKICSVEYLLPNGTKGFQEDCKIETHGNSSRTPNRMQKHSLRLTFSSTVGIPKLNYDLFPDSPVNSFNKLVLRACFTDSWALNTWSAARYRPNDSLYMRDVWMKDILGDMGQPTSYGNFVHLYVNGLYFGVHNLTERIEDDFYAEHLGGEPEDWEINKDLESGGSLWNSMIGTLNGNITTPAVYETAKTKIDVENYADYMILHLFADSEDWPHHNGYASVNAVSGDGLYRFNVWDQEIAFDKYTWNRYSDGRGGGAPFQRLKLNEDFRMLFADRVYKHLNDGGALSIQGASASFMRRMNELDKAIVAESARWGDVQAHVPWANTPGSSNNIDADYYPPTINNPIYFTREQHWIVERDNVLNNYLPTLHDTSDSRSFVRELRNLNPPLYPSIDPPNFSQLGGVVPNNFELELTSPQGGVYYTTDGSDPRLPGGTINPAAGAIGAPSLVTFFDLESTGWRYLDTATAQSNSDLTAGNPAYDATDWKHQDFDDTSWGSGQAMLGDGTIDNRTINTEINIGSIFSRTPTLYFRKEFNVTDASEFTSLSFNSIQDDGIIVYLNGREIYRHNIEPGVVSYDDLADQAETPEGVILNVEHTLLPGQLLEGNNVVAIEVHNQSTTSSDLAIDLALSGLKAATGGNSFTLTQSGTVNSRTRTVSGEWSALRTADFIVGTPGAAGNIVISEIMFNPQGADEDLEFIELMNISATESVDLTDVSFTDGIFYSFPTGFVIPPGGRVVVVKNQAAFAAHYSTLGIVIAPGEFTGSLSNGGENITLTGNNGDPIQSFMYFADGTPGWPSQADGFGPSMVLVNPSSNPAHGVGTNWIASPSSGGSPGLPDSQPLPANPGEDLDGDGLNALAEYFFGTSDSQSNTHPGSMNQSAGGPLLTFPRNPLAGEATWTIELSDDLLTWAADPAAITIQPTTNLPDGRTQENILLNPGSPRKFARVKITAAP
ncbi:MAG: lamin tail domain-containing protein [Verrucomicrobiaceae bacterium]